MIDLEMLTLSDDNDTLDLLADDELAGVVTFDPGWPVPREEVRDRSGSSGEIDTTELHGGRSVAMSIEVYDSQTLSRLVRLAAPSARPVVTFRRVGDASDRRMVLRGTQVVAPHSDGTGLHRVVVNVQWKAPDGIVEAAAVSVRDVNAGGGETGRTYDLTYDRTYPATLGVGAVVIDNAGDESAWPLLRVDGPCTDPRVVNDTAGEELVFAGLVVAEGDYLSIDPRNRTVLLNGDPAQSRYQFLDVPASRWWSLRPGPNTVRFVPASASPPSRLEVTWRDAWLW